MAIKKVRFNFGLSTTNPNPTFGVVKFYTKIGGSWAVYNAGSKVNNTETTNMFIKPSLPKLSTSKDYTALITDTVPLLSFMDVSASIEAYVDFIFKNPIDVINKITYSTRYSNSLYLRVLKITIYDEDDVIIYSNDNSILSTTDRQIVTQTTPELEYIKTYATNKISYIETTDTNQLKQVFGINAIQITNKEIEDETYCRFLFSFDGRQTYKTFDMDSKTWVECAKENIIEKGLTANDLGTSVYKYISNGLEDTATLDILVGMMTMNPIKTPNIQKITVDYLKIKDE